MGLIKLNNAIWSGGIASESDIPTGFSSEVQEEVKFPKRRRFGRLLDENMHPPSSSNMRVVRSDQGRTSFPYGNMYN
jgi:hypothetical protein